MIRAVAGVALLVAALAVPRAAQAQVLIGMLLGDKVASEKFHVGFDFGGNLSFLHGLPGTRPGFGANVGLFGEYRFAEHAYLHVELVATAAMGERHIPADQFDPPVEVPPDLTDVLVERKLNYVALPVLVKGGFFNNRLILAAGLQGMVLTGGRDIYTGTASDELEVVHKRGKDLSRFDAGGLGMVEVKLWPNDPYALSAVARYYQGFVNVEHQSGRAVFNGTVTVSLMLPLGRPPKCPTCDEPEGTPTEEPAGAVP